MTKKVSPLKMAAAKPQARGGKKPAVKGTSVTAKKSRVEAKAPVKEVSPTEHGAKLFEQAANVRLSVDGLHKHYRAVSAVVTRAFGDEHSISHKDVKTAVDAIHYLGGGYPSPNSPGRMEEMLDRMIGMFRLLTIMGRGNMVTDYCAERGVQIKLARGAEIKNKPVSRLLHNGLVKSFREAGVPDGAIEPTEDLSTLYATFIEYLNEVQTSICEGANVIKHEIRPAARNTCGLENAEFGRGLQAAKLVVGSRFASVKTRRKSVTTSVNALESIMEVMTKGAPEEDRKTQRSNRSGVETSPLT